MKCAKHRNYVAEILMQPKDVAKVLLDALRKACLLVEQ